MLEGISFLLLFAVTMPLKYLYSMPLPNQYVGYAHGLLFIVYCLWLYIAGSEKKFSFKHYIYSFIASLVPFGTFLAEAKIFRQYD